MIHVSLDAAREKLIVSNQASVALSARDPNSFQTRFLFDRDGNNDGEDDASDSSEQAEVISCPIAKLRPLPHECTTSTGRRR